MWSSSNVFTPLEAMNFSVLLVSVTLILLDPFTLKLFFLISPAGAVQRAGQVRVQQSVKKMLAGFAAHGEASRNISA